MTTTKRRLKEPQFGLSEVVDILKTIPEFEESLTQADIELALEDKDWLIPGMQYGQYGRTELLPRTRTMIVARSRAYWQLDPLAKQAVRLWTDYCFGETGVTVKVDDQGDQKTLNTFMRSRQNRKLTGYPGQQRLSKRLLVDGELFFAVFGKEADARLRLIDCLQITDFITDPDDDERILCYRRETQDKNKVLYYADWSLDDAGKVLAEKQTDPVSKKRVKLEQDVVVYHLAYDAIGRRGNGLLTSIGSWTDAHKKFMSSRVGLTQALAKFAWKLTAKTGAKGIAAIQNKLQSGLTTSGLNSGGIEHNPPNARGGTWAQNPGADLTPMPRATGAGDAKEDGNQLKLMVCAGTGIMLHYLGDPSTGNLATATAMELPMLKMFAGYQELWKGAWSDLYAIVLDQDPDEEPEAIDVDLPPILAEDLQKLGEFIAQATTVFPELKVPDVLKRLLIALNINNVEDVVKAATAKRTEIDAQPPIVPPVPQPGAPPAPVPAPPQSKEAARAMNRLAKAIEESNRLAQRPLELASA